MSDVQIWRYRFPYCQKGDGGTFFLDSTGVFLAYSAYGAFGYRWTAIGSNCIRSFVAQVGPDYAYSKLVHGHRERFDGDASARAIRKHLFAIDVAVRPEWWDEELELLNEVRSFSDDPEAYNEWLRATHIEEAWYPDHDFYKTVPEPECWAFCTKLLPRLQARLRFDLARESQRRERLRRIG
jgi:hypothetical protein